MHLFCDEMLARLGRWLRAAGYDTAIAEGGMPDTALIARCVTEPRVLLTRDRHLAAVAADGSQSCTSPKAMSQDRREPCAPRLPSIGNTRRSPAA